MTRNAGHDFQRKQKFEVRQSVVEVAISSGFDFLFFPCLHIFQSVQNERQKLTEGVARQIVCCAVSPVFLDKA